MIPESCVNDLIENAEEESNDKGLYLLAGSAYDSIHLSNRTYNFGCNLRTIDIVR